MKKSQNHKITKSHNENRRLLIIPLLVALSSLSFLSMAQDTQTSSDSSLLQDSVGLVTQSPCYLPNVLVSNVLQFETYSQNL